MTQTRFAEAAAATGVAQWGKVVDHTQCIGCHACSTACKSENEVPLSVHRTYVKYVDVGTFPDARRAFQVTRCNQCEVPPCATACPTAAMYKRDDGIVDFDKDICIGCKACIAACPYDAIFINPDDNAAEKCNFCAHRLDVGLEPACVVVCPTEALLVGDLQDPNSRVAQYANRDVTHVRRPEKETRPKLFYKGAHGTTLDPLAAQRPGGGLFMWSEQTEGPQHVVAGHPDAPNSAAAAIVSYDVPHKMPWGWAVSLYTWTKSIAAGAWIVGALLLILGVASPTGNTWGWIAPVLAGLGLAATGALLIADLKQPSRFWMIFLKPQWKSWLVRGAFVIAAFSLVLVLHVLASWAEAGDFPQVLAWVGLPIAIMTAIYTAFLFAQAKARDLWQSTLLPFHLFVQAVLAGAAIMLPFVALFGEGVPIGSTAAQEAALTATVDAWLRTMLAIACGLHILLVLGECTLTHATAHAKLAVREMTRGRYRRFFWASAILVAFGCFAPVAYVEYGALVGLLLYEHAYVQAGQSVPLA